MSEQQPRMRNKRNYETPKFTKEREIEDDSSDTIAHLCLDDID